MAKKVKAKKALPAKKTKKKKTAANAKAVAKAKKAKTAKKKKTAKTAKPKAGASATKAHSAGKPAKPGSVAPAVMTPGPSDAALDLRDRLKAGPRRQAGPPLAGDMPHAAAMTALADEVLPAPTDPKDP
jgi:hypothetical protein